MISGRVTSAAQQGASDRRRVRALLGLLFVGFVVYSLVAVPRLTNDSFGDVEFTGWSGPMASRLLRGERPYVDFILPIPPGSFVLLSAIERLLGRPLIGSELAVNGAIHVVMGALAYVMARSLTTRRNALLATFATFATLIELRKECAYDHTAQLAAWSSVACGLWAFRASDSRRAERLFLAAGALAGFTLFFKQSTAVGIVGGWLAGLVYLLAVDIHARNGDRRRADASVLGHVVTGVAFGVFATWLGLLLLGSTFRAFFQATFVDGSALKGGGFTLAKDLFVYLFDYPAYRGSLAVVLLLVAVGARLVARGATLHLGAEHTRVAPLGRRETAFVAALIVLSMGGGAAFLLHGPAGYRIQLVPLFDSFRGAQALSLVVLCVVFAAHLLEPPAEGADPALDEEIRRGHVVNAMVLVASSASLFHNTSAPEFRPFYDNNAMIPLALTVAFVALDRASLHLGAHLFLTVIVASAAGERFYRASTTRTRIEGGPASGLRVNAQGRTMLRVAQRVRALTGPDDAVLVLPEDLEIAQLIGRPRPPLLGAIVFVDQYPERLLADDETRLSERLPKVIVIHPRNAETWQEFFRIWSGRSAAEQMIRHVIDDVLPSRYERVASYETVFHFHPERLDVYVRRDRPSGAPAP